MPTRRQCANAIRALAIDAIEQCKSGHPGAPLGMADMAEALWRHVLRYNPANPSWCDRDRFVLSNGHASMLLYAVLHLTGHDVTMDDLKEFRQWGSRTPGHPERGVTPGVDMTTGPLGQGIAAAVGMALAERLLAKRYNTPEHAIVNHRTFVFLGDGCIMEGVSHEACSLAGTWKLGRLIALYDANGISIDGDISPWFTEDVAKRYESYGWQVIGPIDGHDFDALDRALAEACADETRPSLIICRTHIGYGSDKADSASCHGAPLGGESADITKRTLEWPHPPFTVPDDIRDEWDFRDVGQATEDAWNAMFAEYRAANGEMAKEFQRRMAGELPEDWEAISAIMVQIAQDDAKGDPTRVSSREALECLVPALPELIGGSADLSGSVGTQPSAAAPLDAAAFEGNHISYGVREFAMGDIMIGMAIHGGFIPYGGTFLVFADYARSALRLAALMGVKGIWVFSHDSIAVGEDGPTHQPVEQVSAMRLMPGLEVWRPCDSVETAAAWKHALAHDGPSSLILSRQPVPFMQRDDDQVAAIERGGYILRDCEGAPDLIFIATGSEMGPTLAATTFLRARGRKVRVVSMPCCERFDRQDAEYRESVLPSSVRARVAVEAGSSAWWRKYVGLDGAVVGMDGFGASAPCKVLCKEFGFSADNIAAVAEHILN